MRKYLSMFMTLVCAASLLVPGVAAALGTDPGGSVGVRALVSKDGVNWLNYSNTNSESPSSQTLTVNPGDTIYLKGEVWNAGEVDVFPGMFAMIKNGQYLQDVEAFDNLGGNNDLDGDGILYNVLDTFITTEYYLMPLEFSAPLTVIPPVGTQSGMIRATIRSDVPKDTVIEGVFALFQTQVGGPTSIGAQDEISDGVESLPENSRVRILANPTVPATTLPQTGSNADNSIVYIIVLSLSFIAIIGVVKFANAKVKE